MKKRTYLLKFATSLIQPLFALLIALLVGSVLMLLSGTNPLIAFQKMFIGALGNKYAIADSLTRATPLIFTGLAATFAFRAGIFNIGAEGQLYWGALAATWVALLLRNLNLPSEIYIPICIIAAMVGGALWALPAGILHVKLGINIVLSTLMLNPIAQYLTAYIVAYPMKGELDINASLKIPETARLFRLLPPSQLNFGIIIALVIGVIVYIILSKSAFGYELRALGKNSKFAEYIGVPVNKMIIQGIMISGAIAGLAGAEQVLGIHYRFMQGFSPGYAFSGITAALLGRLNPISTIFSAILLGVLESGALKMEISTNISRDLTIVIQAVIILMLGAEQIIKKRAQKKSAKINEKELVA